MPSNTALSVAVGIIRNGKNQVLLSRRSSAKEHANLWEFPGGKVESNETVNEALARELLEEVDLTIEVTKPLIKVRHEYERYTVLLDVWSVDLWRSDLLINNGKFGKEGQEIAWVDIEDIGLYEFPSANKAIIRRLQLPDFYLICPAPDPKDECYLKKFNACLAAGVRLFQLRFGDERHYDKHRKLIEDLFCLCKKADAKLLLNTSPAYASKIGVHGVHLNSTRLMRVGQPWPDHDFMVAASCHNKDELEHAINLRADFVVLSPLRRTMSYPNKKPLGWRVFNQLVKSSSIPVYALGGMCSADITKSIQQGGQGIAVMGGVWNSSHLEEVIRRYMCSSPYRDRN